MSGPLCRTCGSSATRFTGELPDGYLFAGRPLTEPLPGGGLWRCKSCNFAFRHPMLDEKTYECLYRAGSLGVWDSELRREDFNLIRQRVLPLAGAAIDAVDIGCYSGQLLASLPKSFRLFGVEPNIEASRLAAARGVTIVAETIDAFANENRKYDLITACDVLEHVPNPLALLEKLGRCLKPSGRLIITTGNCDAWLWRIIGADYWYCRFPEHTSFIGTRWVKKMPRRAGLELIEITRFNYRGGIMSGPRILAAIFHRIHPRLYRFVRQAFAGSPVGDVPPGSGATKDHMLCVFEPS